ncbi:MAG: hypothetical protein IPN19_05045 [Elusimicrobia bacterium]|nr:hypothetical protein [Elusimicrobiota bacterium]
MRQLTAVFLSLSVALPASLFSYDDYSRYERGPDSYSFNNLQETWKRNFNARESFNYNAPFTRSPIQFPKVSLDLTFQNTFRSFSSFNSTQFDKRLDLNYKSFSSSSFSAKPVVQTYDFKAPTNLIRNLNFHSPGVQSTEGTFVPSIPQPKVPIGFFSGVASAVKTIPAFFLTVASKIGEAASFLWNRVVLGHRTENTATLPDGTFLTGQITLNRDDKILSIAPGTVRTVGEFKQLETGEMALVPGKSPITINGNEYFSGQFVYDGEKFHLDGPGIKLTNQAGPTIQTTAPFKEYVNGDAQGNETVLGYGALSRNDTFRETTTGLSFRNTNGVWSFDPNQSAVLKVDGKNIPVAIDEQGRFKETVKSPTAEPAAYITNVLPSPGTSGYEIEKVTPLTGHQTIRTDIPGTKPSSLTTGQTNDWRQKTGALFEVKGQRTDSATNATVHQEGDQYVFTSGQVATVSVSAPKERPQEGQKTLYTEALFGSGTRLTVTGKTEFPNYEATVYVGKVMMGGSGKLNMEKGTIFASEDRGLRLTVHLNGGETAIAVKSIDRKSGTFVALLPDIPLKTGEHVRPITREVAGRIDAENGQAILTNKGFQCPILKPRETPGFWETVPEVTGNGHIHIKDNKITLNTDRLANLSDYKNLDERKPVWTTTMRDRYDTALSAFAGPENNLIIRSGGLVLATAMVIPKLVEETVAFVVDCVHPASEFAVHSFLVVHEKDPVEKLRAAGKATDNFGEFFIRAEAGATAAVTGGALVVREGTPIIRNAVRSVSKLLEKPTALAPQPARSLGAAARSELADPVTTKYELVRREQDIRTVSWPQNLIREAPLAHKPSWKGERVLSPTPGKTTTLIGNYKGDMQHILAEIEYPKTTDFGVKEGGFNLLNVPDDVTIGIDFWKQFNEPWLQQATTRGDVVVVVSNPFDHALLSKGGRLTGFGREVDFMNRLVSDGKYEFIVQEGKYVPRR